MKRSSTIFGAMVLITVAHYVSPTRFFLWHEILERLYYLPIVFAALSYGWVGGVAAALCAGLCYLPHILMSWHAPAAMAARYAEIAVFLAVGGLTGLLADKARRRENALRETTRELSEANTRLQETSRHLRHADRLSAIGQLAASLAHEIRNPLGSIEGAVDIVERTASQERRLEFLGVIRKETRRLSLLLSNLLDFSRPRSPEMRAAAIESVVRPVVDLISHNARQKSVRLDANIEPDLPPIECDAEQIKQALLNITLNALQATTSGGAISISVRREVETVQIAVQDEGDGIDEANLGRIFDPFYTTKEAGTGLGLAISHQIVTQHHGRITVERNPLRGVTFTVFLPFRQTT